MNSTTVLKPNCWTHILQHAYFGDIVNCNVIHFTVLGPAWSHIVKQLTRPKNNVLVFSWIQSFPRHYGELMRKNLGLEQRPNSFDYVPTYGELLYSITSNVEFQLEVIENVLRHALGGSITLNTATTIVIDVRFFQQIKNMFGCCWPMFCAELDTISKWSNVVCKIVGLCSATLQNLVFVDKAMDDYVGGQSEQTENNAELQANDVNEIAEVITESDEIAHTEHAAEEEEPEDTESSICSESMLIPIVFALRSLRIDRMLARLKNLRTIFLPDLIWYECCFKRRCADEEKQKQPCECDDCNKRYGSCKRGGSGSYNRTPWEAPEKVPPEERLASVERVILCTTPMAGLLRRWIGANGLPSNKFVEEEAKGWPMCCKLPDMPAFRGVLELAHDWKRCRCTDKKGRLRVQNTHRVEKLAHFQETAVKQHTAFFNASQVRVYRDSVHHWCHYIYDFIHPPLEDVYNDDIGEAKLTKFMDSFYQTHRTLTSDLRFCKKYGINSLLLGSDGDDFVLCVSRLKILLTGLCSYTGVPPGLVFLGVLIDTAEQNNPMQLFLPDEPTCVDVWMRLLHMFNGDERRDFRASAAQEQILLQTYISVRIIHKCENLGIEDQIRRFRRLRGATQNNSVNGLYKFPAITVIHQVEIPEDKLTRVKELPRDELVCALTKLKLSLLYVMMSDAGEIRTEEENANDEQNKLVRSVIYRHVVKIKFCVKDFELDDELKKAVNLAVQDQKVVVDSSESAEDSDTTYRLGDVLKDWFPVLL